MYSVFSARMPDHSILLMGNCGTEEHSVVYYSYSETSFLLYMFITRDVLAIVVTRAHYKNLAALC